MFKFATFIAFTVFFACFSQTCFAQTLPRINIGQISLSGRTVILDIGRNEGLREGSHGSIVVLYDGVYEFISRGEIKKLNDRESLWFMQEPLLPEKVSKDEELYLASELLLKGRKKLRLDKGIRVSTSGFISRVKNLPQYVKKKFMISDLEQEKSVTVERRLDPEEEIYIPEVDEDVGVVEIDNSIFDPEKEKEISRTQRDSRKARVDNLIKGSLAKVNNRREKLNFYHDLDKFSERSSLVNTFDSFLDAIDSEKKIDSKYHSSKKYLDPLWKSELSDKELREYFLSTQKKRLFDREKISNFNRPGNEVYLRLHYSFIKQTSELDSSFQSTNKTFSAGYEWHLMRVEESLRYLALEMAAEVTNGHYEVKVGENFATGDIDFRVMTNLYLNALPSRINKFIWFLGLGGRLGAASLSGQSLNRDSSYFKITFPSGQLGMKYRFLGGDEYSFLPRVGFGIHANLVLDYVDLSLSNENQDNLRGSFSAVDLKFATGINFYF